MSNLANLEFVALDISGDNYLSWKFDAEIHLDSRGLGDTIKEGKEASSQDKAKAMIFLRHHIHEGLKNEYLTVKDPQVLWKTLKERYDHQNSVILSKARNEWIHLCFQDFKSVSDYNSALLNITSKLKLCGEKITDDEMLEKTLSTFHASNRHLEQQYREKGFTKYSDLISCLLVVEQNNELLMKNHESHPTGTTPFLEVNAATHDQGQSSGCGRGQSNGRGRCRNNSNESHPTEIGPFPEVNVATQDQGQSSGRGRGRNSGRGRGRGRGRGKNSNFLQHKWKNSGKNEKAKGTKSNKHTKNICHRCGNHGHWARFCRTPKHLVDMYQESLKNKVKATETNFAGIDDGCDDGQMDVTHLDINDLLAHPKGKSCHLTEDGSAQK